MNYYNLKMSKTTLIEILSINEQQRRQRQAKRNAFKIRIQALQQNQIIHSKPISSKYVQSNSSQKVTESNSNKKEHREEQSKQRIVGQQSEIQSLLEQNKQLLKQIVQLQHTQKDTLTGYQKIIQQIKDKYIVEMDKMKSGADQRTNQLHDKALKIKLQTEATKKKNQELQKANQSLKTDILEGNKAMGKQIILIKQSYADKLEQIQKIFSSSNQKIQTFQRQFNQDQLVQNTLINLEISAKQAEQGQALVQEYKNLVNGKNEILDELKGNNKMKEDEIKKLSDIEVRMKDIARRITQDKLILIKQNQKMVEQLKQLKDIMVDKQ